MKTIKNIGFAIGCLMAYLTVEISDDMLLERQKHVVGIELYPMWVLIAVLFLRWYIWNNFIPWGGLSRDERKQLEAEADKVGNSLGTVRGLMAFGYLFIASYAVLWFISPSPLDISPRVPYNPVWAGLLLIGLAMCLRLRNVIKLLMAMRRDPKPEVVQVKLEQIPQTPLPRFTTPVAN